MWFYSGTYMKDGVPITIAARSPFMKDECLRRGLRPLEDKKKRKASPKSASFAGSKKNVRTTRSVPKRRGTDIEG